MIKQGGTARVSRPYRDEGLFFIAKILIEEEKDERGTSFQTRS